MGCKIPADMRMIEMLSNQLRVDQAILTGTSVSSSNVIILHGLYHLLRWQSYFFDQPYFRKDSSSFLCISLFIFNIFFCF